MSNILVISEREEIIKVIDPICNGKEKTIKSSEEAVTYLDKNKPSLVILDLEVQDLNIFVAHELLKVCKSTNDSIVIIVVSETTKNEIEDYKKLLHPPDEFLKDSEIIISLDELLKKYSILPKIVKASNKKEPKDESPFAEELYEDIEEMDIFDNELLEDNESSQGIFTVEDAKDHSGEIDLSFADSSEIKTKEIELKKVKKKPEEKKIEDKKQPDKEDLEKHKIKISELNAEILSMEKQNGFMKKENKELLIINSDLKEDLKKSTDGHENIEEELSNLNSELEKIKNENKEKVSILTSDIEQIKSDKKILETSLMDEINTLKSDKVDLEEENEQNKSTFDSLKKEFEEVEKQLESETKEIKNIKKEIGDIEKAKDEKEKILISSIDHLKKNIKTEEDKNKINNDKLDKITKISKNLSAIISDEKSD